ncbi:MAG TPA: hypothetical protein VF273_04190 [Pelobium sp.]
MKQYRLNRLFNPASGNCFDVAIDHGFFNEQNFLFGIEDIQKAVNTIVDAQPDAVQLTIGQAHYLQNIPGRFKPSLVLRTDVANVYGKELPKHLFSRMIEQAVEQAINLDATCVVVNLFQIPNQPVLADQCIQNILKIKPLCERYGIPLMIEPLIFKANDKFGSYMVDGNINSIISLVRQAVELGADIIKADPCDNVQQYHKVVEIAGKIPVLVRGGGRASDQEILERTHELMIQGAKGIVYGRNVVQHHNPNAMVKALMGITHQGLSVENALKIINS